MCTVNPIFECVILGFLLSWENSTVPFLPLTIFRTELFSVSHFSGEMTLVPLTPILTGSFLVSLLLSKIAFAPCLCLTVFLTG